MADLGDAGDFIERPDATTGVVRRAEQVHAWTETIHLFLEQVEVDAIGAIAIDERVFDYAEPVVVRRVAKGVVDRRVEDDAVVGLAECLIQVVDGRDGSIGECDPLALDLVVMAAALPVDDGVVKAVVRIAIAVCSVLGYLGQTRADCGGGGKVHVGDPHGNVVIPSLREFLLDDGGVPLASVIERAVSHGIEVVNRHKVSSSAI